MNIKIAYDLVDFLEFLGINVAFGISGGFIVPIWQALSRSKKINVIHCRTEVGSVFCALEYSLCHDKIAISFVTAGPGITNSLTGLKTAKLDGARVIFISAITTEYLDGLWGAQETTAINVNALVQDDGQGYLDKVFIIKNEDEYLQARNDIQKLVLSRKHFVIGVFLTTGVQTLTIKKQMLASFHPGLHLTNIISSADVSKLIELLLAKKSLFWLGFGARHANKDIQKIIELTNSAVIATPRGKGIISEFSKASIGTTGIGSIKKRIVEEIIGDSSRVVIVIMGTRLGEFSAFYLQKKFNNVDLFYIGLEADKVRNNLPFNAIVFKSDIQCFTKVLLNALLDKLTHKPAVQYPALRVEFVDYVTKNNNNSAKTLHPVDVMNIIQKVAINENNCYVAAEAGNSFCWASHYLKFFQPGRYRVGTAFGVMGHYACGLVGIAAGNKECAIGIIGDGAMLMVNEVSTAVRYSLPAIWLVMNDSSYNMCRQGLEMLNSDPLDCDIPATDFALFGRALGANGYQVNNSQQLHDVMVEAIKNRNPTVIDIKIDKNVVPPIENRIERIKGLIND
ncbi:thiamine pyrophosphate-binding protein [Arsenophonus apicola]|uniref:Thiamine pyrophosphate-binding protein n=1 Tax=Arsenophonus apicola TaxID=2879119 RepID=A0ABY8NZ38_9GAMM|nr:thiamine pyrophosphate-dependent enzyme [Arsenophonus apicola]WGO82501.1 thiamine pyrophosphate-binding protein [Arsenophonus apicola]